MKQNLKDPDDVVTLDRPGAKSFIPNDKKVYYIYGDNEILTEDLVTGDKTTLAK